MELGLDAILESAEEDCDELSDYEEEEEEEEPNDDNEEADDQKISVAIASTLAVAAPSPLPPHSSQLSIEIPPPVLEEGEIASPSGAPQLEIEIPSGLFTIRKKTRKANNFNDF